jgi:heme-degrading monooxygenase HmoA
MFAGVHPAEVSQDAFDTVVGFAEAQILEFETQRGFNGFYLMTDRESGELLTISFWESLEDVRRMEASAAHSGAAAASETGDVVAPPVKTYEVEIAHPSS